MPAGFFVDGRLRLMDSLLSFFISDAAAQTAAPAAAPSLISTLLLPVMLIVVFYFLLIRPQQKKAKEHRAMVEALGVGTEIVTGGGVLGKVTELGEQFVTIEIADGVKVKIQRHSISAVLAQGHDQARLRRVARMNRYPLWKNLLVFGVILVSTIVALPNVFGDDEAVQVSRTDGVAVDAPALEQIRMALTEGGVEYLSAAIEGTSALVRVETSQKQETRARRVDEGDAEQHRGADAVAAHAGVGSKSLGLEPMLLGLDLRGGVHFLYQVDLSEAVRQFLETYESGPAHAVSRERHPQRHSQSQARSCRSRSSSRPTSTAPRRSSARSTPAISCCSSVSSRAGSSSIAAQIDGRPGFNVRLTESADPRARRTSRSSKTRVTLRNRVNELGVAEAVVQRQGLDRILVELPGIQDPAQAKRVLGSTATLEFHLVDMENDAFEAERRGRAPLGSELHKRRKDGGPILLRRDVIASGDQLIDAIADVPAGPARRQHPARCGRRRARCSIRRSTTSAGRWPCCSSRIDRNWSSATANGPGAAARKR